MEVNARFLCLLLGLLFCFSLVAASESMLRLVTEKLTSSELSGSLDDSDDIVHLSCNGWRLAVEANNAGPWVSTPDLCVPFVNRYINGTQYQADSDVIAEFSLDFAKTVKISGDGKDAWIFDIDETLLSNFLPSNAPGNGKISPALPASLWLYKELQKLGFKIIILTGRGEATRNLTKSNLLLAGYKSWERLILRQTADDEKPAIVYKPERRAELVAEGFRIHGSSGDQWSDLLGEPMATRSFKLPNPVYYVE